MNLHSKFANPKQINWYVTLKYVPTNFGKQSQICKYIIVVYIHYGMHFCCGNVFKVKWLNICLFVTNKMFTNEQIVKFLTDIPSIT